MSSSGSSVSTKFDAANNDFLEQLGSLQSQLLDSKLNFQTKKNGRSIVSLRREIARMLTSERTSMAAARNWYWLLFHHRIGISAWKRSFAVLLFVPPDKNLYESTLRGITAIPFMEKFLRATLSAILTTN